jgi:hypothetical protein
MIKEIKVLCDVSPCRAWRRWAIDKEDSCEFVQ